MVDGPVLGVGGGDAVIDEPFVERQVGERAVLGQPVGASWAGPVSLSVFGIVMPEGPGLVFYGKVR